MTRHYAATQRLATFCDAVKDLFPDLPEFLPPEVPEHHLRLCALHGVDRLLSAPESLLLCADLLSAAERKIFAAFRYPKRRREWLGGRLAAKACVQALLSKQAADQIVILPGKNGEPALAFPHSDDLNGISISHSGDLAAAMVTRQVRCGIDLQQITLQTVRVKERFASPSEEALLRDALDTWAEAGRLTILWAAKEAVKKCLLSDQPVFFEAVRLEKIISCHSAALVLLCHCRDRPVTVYARPLDNAILACTFGEATSHA